MVRCSSIAVSVGSAPARAEIAASRPSSSGDRALASSSCGSMPSRRTTQFADSFSSRTIPPVTLVKPIIPPADHSAAGIGRASAAFFGTSSPKSMENRVARPSASSVVEPVGGVPGQRPQHRVEQLWPAPARRGSR